MLSEEELNKYLNKQPPDSETDIFASTLEASPLSVNSAVASASGFNSILNPDTSEFNQDKLLDNFNNAINNASRNIMKNKVRIDIDNKDIKGAGPKGSRISKLIQLILSIVKLPKRFLFLSKSIAEATAALTVSIDGIGKSVALGIRDIYMLIIAILNIIFKYFLCILSFTITTIAGCSFVHIITFIVLLVKLGVLYAADFIEWYIGVALTDMIEDAFGYVQWPEPINTICYSCFGKKVKLRDILTDVRVIEDIGNMITYDFNKRMPRYMRPGIPLGRAAMKSLDKAIK